MPVTKGKLLECDRCGKTLFLKYLSTITTDGGYGDNYDTYEDAPKRWLHETQFGWLCPECADAFKLFVSNFVGGRIAPAWKHPDFMNDEEKKLYGYLE